MPEVASYLIGALVVLLLVFLIGRELVTWYWKINEHLENQKKQIKLLTEISYLLKNSSGSSKAPQKPPSSIKCLKCHSKNEINQKYCTNCGNEL